MLSAILIGLGIGGLYAIAALGIVTIHRGTGVLNLAHGILGTWGAYVYVQGRKWLGSDALSFVMTVAGGAVAGVLIYLLLIRPIRHRPQLSKMVMTLGILAVMTSLLKVTFNTDYSLNVATWLPAKPVEIFGARVSEDRLILLGVAVVLTLVLEFWSSRARLPLFARAASENERGAMALGISPHVVGAFTWALGCALAAAVGALIVPIVGLGPTSVGYVLIPALGAALLGRFDDYRWALAGGLLLGVAESVVTRYVTSPGWSAGAPLLLIVAVLLLQRDSSGNRLPAQHAPAVARGRFQPIPAVVAFVGAGAILWFGDNVYRSAMVYSMCFALLGLSMTVILGYAYQMSLAQFAFAGISALVAAQMSIHIGLPFVLAPLVGAVVGGVFGVIIGLPALLIRGTNLAVVTLALGVAIENIVFNNSDYTGGFIGLAPPTPTIFGYDVSPATHPQRYGFVILVWVAIVSALVLWLRRSALGRQLLAIRTNERAAAAIGVNVTRAKLTAFGISAAIAGVAGVLFANQQTVISFLDFNSDNSINLVVLSVIAGAGSIAGGWVVGVSAVGGVVYQYLGNIPAIQDKYFLIAGAGLCMAVIFNEHGMTLGRRLVERDNGQRLPDATHDAASGEVLEVNNVRVAFGGVLAVDYMAVRVEPGVIVGVVGPNGAGKTTLLDMISGYIRGSAIGVVQIGSRTLHDKPTYARARAGLARGFQAIELFEDLTVGENLLLAAESSARNKGGFPAPAAAAANGFGIDSMLYRRPSSLSLAQRNLCGVVRAMAINPAVLVLDEPGAGLSRAESLALAGEIRRFAAESGVGVLLIDHDMGLVTATCDKLVVMANGSELAHGEPGAVLRDSRVRDVYLGESPVVVLETQDGSLTHAGE